MRKKIIGIPAWDVGGNIGAGGNHYRFIERFGNPRIISPWENFIPDIDMIYLPGGPDLNSASYGEAPKSTTGMIDPMKQYFFDHHLPQYIKAGKAIYGVCLGAQMIAAYFGSTLVQDLVNHPQSGGRGKIAHEIFPYPLSDKDRLEILNQESAETEDEFDEDDIEELDELDEEELEAFLKEQEEQEERKVSVLVATEIKGAIGVNSHHHQAVTLNRLGEDLVPLYVYPNHDSYFSGDDDIIEVFRHKSLPIVGIQYHPEDMLAHGVKDLLSVNLIKELLEIK